MLKKSPHFRSDASQTIIAPLLLAAELQAMGAESLTLYIDGFEVWKKYGGATSSSPADIADTVPPEGLSK